MHIVYCPFIFDSSPLVFSIHPSQQSVHGSTISSSAESRSSAHTPPSPFLPPIIMGKKQQQLHSYDVDIETVMQIQSRPPQYVCSPPQENWFPWLVPMIFIIDVAAFVYTMYINNCPSNSTTNEECIFPSLGRFSFEPISQNPLLGPSLRTLEKLGALEWKEVVKKNEAWRLFTCMWLHAGVIHLVANMMSLLFVGIRLEQEFGFLKIGLLFVLSGFGGSLLSSINLQSKVSVGASGALFGFLGAMLSELITNWTIYANKCAALMTLIFVIALNLGVSILPHVDSSAHIGGFLSGLLLGFILLPRPQFGWVSRKHIPPGYDMSFVKSKYKIYQYFLCATALVVLATGYAYGLAKLFNVHSISRKQ